MAPPLVSLATSFSLAALLLLPVAVHQEAVISLSWSAWALLACLGLIATALGYLVFLVGMRHTPVTVASVITLLEPLLAVVLAMLLFGEQLAAQEFLGGGILLLSLGLLPLMLNTGHAPPGRRVEASDGRPPR